MGLQEEVGELRLLIWRINLCSAAVRGFLWASCFNQTLKRQSLIVCLGISCVPNLISSTLFHIIAEHSQQQLKSLRSGLCKCSVQ